MTFHEFFSGECLNLYSKRLRRVHLNKIDVITSNEVYRELVYEV